jgi:hypothetical protein
MFGTLIGRAGNPRRPRAEEEARAKPPRLVVKTRCVLVADVCAIDSHGRRETLASGLEEEAARALFLELSGRPWTRTEATSWSQPVDVS